MTTQAAGARLIASIWLLLWCWAPAPRAWMAWLCAAGNVVICAWTVWQALPQKMERLLAVLGITAISFSLGAAVWLADPITIKKYRMEYLVLTPSFVIATAAGLLAAVYCRTGYSMWSRAQTRCAVIGAYFTVDVAVNAMSRWIWDESRMPGEAQHDWRILVLIRMLWHTAWWIYFARKA